MSSTLSTSSPPAPRHCSPTPELQGRRFHSLVINYAWDKAVRIDADGNEIERIGSEVKELENF